MNKAEKRIKGSLNDKYQIMLKLVEFLNKKTKIDENELYDFLNTNLKKIDDHSLDEIIVTSYDIIQKWINDNNKLINDNEYISLMKELYEVNIILNSNKKYYNKNSISYNKMINNFFGNILSKIYKYSKKEKYIEVKLNKLKILED